jgi:hypothetical protein
MLPKFFASWLVVLVLVPFTAPFSICNLPGLAGSARAQHHPLFARRTLGAGRERRHPDEDLASNTAVPCVPAIFAAKRLRLLPLSDAPLVQTRHQSPPARSRSSGAATGRIKEHTVLTTILRL